MAASARTPGGIRRSSTRYGPYVAAFLLVPLIVGAANLGRQLSSAMHPSEPPAYASALPAAPKHDPQRPVAVVLSSAYGAEITDFLPPYEILARSGHFQVYALAPERKALPLVNSGMKATSLDFVPHFSFDEYAKAVGRAPDVIAVPWFPEYTPTRDVAVVEWIRANAGPNTTLLTICAGTEILADTGLLDGRTATTNLGWFGKLEPRFTTTKWVRNVRYYDDGSVVTSTNLASGIDATLRVVAKHAGRQVAEDVARQLGYRSTHYLDDPSFQASMSFFAQVVPSIAYQFGREEMGVLLYDGVSEMALAGLVDPYTASYVARTHAVAPERQPVASRNGLTFLPRFDSRTAQHLDRVVLPGGDRTAAATSAVRDWSAMRSEPVEEIHREVGAGVSAYDATLADIGRRQNSTLASGIGQGLYYSMEGIDLVGARPPIGTVAAPVGLGVVGLALVYGLRAALSASRRGRASRVERLGVAGRATTS